MFHTKLGGKKFTVHKLKQKLIIQHYSYYTQPFDTVLGHFHAPPNLTTYMI